MIKIFHSSDWHLGKSLFAKSLLEDQRTALAEFTTMIALEKPDLVLLAGDLYDRSIPPEDAVKLLDQFLAKTILESRVPVAMIPGNHDSSTRVGVGADLLRAAGLHVFSTPESITSPLRIEAGGVKASIYGIPYLEPSEWNYYFSELARKTIGAEEKWKPIRTHADALTAILEHLDDSLAKDRTEGRRTVLMLHAYMTGGEPSESERPLSIGGSDLIPSELVVNFDYVALGHLHRPQIVSSDRIRYPGSLFPYSQSEAAQDKGAVLISLGNKPMDDAFDFLKFQTTRKLRVVRGTLEELIQSGAEVSHDYVIALLSDQALPFEAFRRLSHVFPGLLHVGREVTWSRSDAEAADVAARLVKREISDRDVLAQFVTTAAASEISDEDREWLLAQLEAFTKAEDQNPALENTRGPT